MKPKLPGDGDTGDGSGDGLPPGHHAPPPKTGGGGTVIPPPPPIYRAADGSPVTIQFAADGQISSAQATGKDGVLRGYSTGTNRSVQTYTEGTLAPLTVSVGFEKLRNTVAMTVAAGAVRLVYEVLCTSKYGRASTEH